VCSSDLEAPLGRYELTVEGDDIVVGDRIPDSK